VPETLGSPLLPALDTQELHERVTTLLLPVPNGFKLSGERSGAERVRCSALLGDGAISRLLAFNEPPHLASAARTIATEHEVAPHDATALYEHRTGLGARYAPRGVRDRLASSRRQQLPTTARRERERTLRPAAAHYLPSPNVLKLSGERSGAERVRCSALLGALERFGHPTSGYVSSDIWLCLCGPE